MKKISNQINISILENFIGLTFNKYKCNDFVFTNSVYQNVGLYIDHSILLLNNSFQSMEYFGTNEDISIFNLKECEDKDVKSGIKNSEMKDNFINKKISSIRVINENRKIFVKSILEYDVDLTRAIIFTFHNGEELCFEKDSWIFSEEIIINRGHNLINVITNSNEFYEKINENSDMSGELSRSDIILN